MRPAATLALLGLCAGCGRIGFDAANVAATDADTIDDAAVDATTNTFGFRKRITIDGTRVAGVLTDFPVLVHLTSDADLAASAQDDGDDISFTDVDGVARLAHEIEMFDGATGELVAWVKLPALSSGTDADVYLYFGDATASNQQDADAVWDAEYMAVWHMQDAAAPANDSTARQNDGVQSGAVTFGAVGTIAGAVNLDGVSSYFDAGTNSSTDLVASGALTISGWFTPAKLPTSSDWQTPVFCHVSNTSNYQLRYGTDGAATGIYALAVEDGTQYRSRTSPQTGAGVADHIVATWDGTVARIYANGVENSNAVSTSISGGTVTNLRLGTKDDGAPASSVTLGGIMDEVRLSRVARSPEWIATGHANQLSPPTFYSVGPVEVL